MKERRWQQACAANMKQLGTAVHLYTEDWDGNLVLDDWYQGLVAYAKTSEIFTCPTVAENSSQGGYAMDSRLAGVALKAVPDPRSAVLLFESVSTKVGSSDPQASLLTTPRHDGLMNFVYADGHMQAK
jgi:prepilin-type processing-associated H-X9-DG protein